MVSEQKKPSLNGISDSYSLQRFDKGRFFPHTITDFLAHQIRISEIYTGIENLTHAILPRTPSNVIMLNCILLYSGTSEKVYFKTNKQINKTVVSEKEESTIRVRVG